MKRSAMTVLLVLLTAVLASGPANAATERPWATIGTGALTGVYYNCGQAIRKTLDRFPGDPLIKISVEETQGSVENLDAVTSGRFYFGIIQSDIQYKAWNGVNGSPWAGRPRKNLRAVLSIYTEAINLVASRQANVQNLSDLKNRRIAVNIGKPGSGQYVNALDLLNAVGIDPQQDILEVQVSPVEALDLFRRRQIDAFFYTAGHPASQFHEVAGGERQAQFVALNPEDEILAKYPYYMRTMIPMKHYPGMANEQDVATIGMRATLVASADTPDWMVYGLIKALSDHFDFFQTQLLIFGGISNESILEGLTAPLHPGALKFYREKGLVP